jgi:hypothetical protein
MGRVGWWRGRGVVSEVLGWGDGWMGEVGLCI